MGQEDDILDELYCLIAEQATLAGHRLNDEEISQGRLRLERIEKLLRQISGDSLERAQ